MTTPLLPTIFLVGSSFACSSCGGRAAVDSLNANVPAHDMANMGSMPTIDPSIALRTPEPTGEPYDLKFIDSMIYHHEATIQMANMVAGKTTRGEMKTFARKLIDEQRRDIDQMKAWRNEWY